MEEKPKRTLSPEALQKLQLARKKALEAKRQNKEITKFEKEQIRQEKQQKPSSPAPSEISAVKLSSGRVTPIRFCVNHT